jgi:hypothetical protein
MTVFKARIQMELEVEGKGRFPITQFGSDWALNSIPSASCLLAVGRKMTDGVTVSPAHKGIWSVRKKDKVRVFFQAEGQYDEKNEWPRGEFTIFEGRVEGVGKQMMLGKLFLSIYMSHWLSYLDNASALSASSHPDNPLQFSFSTLVNKAIVTGVAPQPMGMFQTAVASHFATDWTTVGANLWGEGFKSMFCRLLQEKTIAFSHDLVRCIPDLVAEVRQPEMLEALKRIAGVSTKTKDCSSPLPAYAPPLRITAAGGLPIDVVRALGNAVGSEMMQSFAGQTMWAKLINYASDFMFSVVPMVHKAVVVPFLPITRPVYCKDLEATDNEVEQFSSRINRSLRAVAVYTQLSSLTGLEAAISLDGTAGLAGCFSPTTADKKGLIWTVPVPSWLANLRTDGLSAVKSTGLKEKAIACATTPRAIDAKLKGRGADKEAVFRTTTDLFNAYAQSIYALEVLRGRAGQISGRLRFDIAPGSMVRVKSTGEPFVIADELRDTVIGAVTGVAIGINAESAAAGTSFRLEYFRTEDENKEDSTSLPKHPLYLDVFKGAPLMEELQFGACDG